MKRRIIQEQDEKQTKKTNLTRAIELGCFDRLGITINPETPQEKDGNVILFAKGNESQADFQVTFEPDVNQKDAKGLQQLGKIVKTLDPKEFNIWTCRPLQTELSKKPEEKKEPPKEEENNNDPELTTLKDALKAAKANPLKEIEVKDCVSAIKLFFKYSKNAPQADLGQFHEVVKNSVSKCARQENMKKLNRKNKQEINTMLQTIANYAQRDKDKGKYKIVNLPLIENRNLNSLVKEVLNETKVLKENRLILEKICESRLKIVSENMDDFENMSRVRKIKFGFRFLKESSELLEIGLIKENLTDIFQNLYGKSMEDMIGAISEPLLISLLTKIGLDEDLKGKVLTNIQSKGTEIIPSMGDCKSLTNFISAAISEELTKKMNTENIIQSDVVNTSLMDTLKNSSFLENLNSKLESSVCELYDKFTENAKNLVVRMSAL
jgi:hypothetical protein